MIEAAAVRLDRYRQLRQVAVKLHEAVFELLPPEASTECARRLGILHQNTLVFESEYEMCVLMDHCLYDYRWEGKNAVERYIAQTPPRPGTDEALVLDAMLKAHYSVFEIEEVHRGVGMRIRDLFFEGDDRFLVDLSMSRTAWEGLLIATRVETVAGEGYWTTTGAGLPVDERAARRLFREVPRQFGRPPLCLPADRAGEFAGMVMRILLEEHASCLIRAEGPEQHEIFQTAKKIGRNDPCPCGSGKKYKRCCGGA